MISHDLHNVSDGRDHRGCHRRETLTKVARSTRPFVLVTSDEFKDAAIGLRVFDCFSSRGPTLTAQQVSEVLEESQDVVTRHAEHLARIDYLRADPWGEPDVWTVTRHVR
ncbi:MAG TPA: hypothetical protein VIJ39_12610 [Solirubrobacteraceae bacterium]